MQILATFPFHLPQKKPRLESYFNLRTRDTDVLILGTGMAQPIPHPNSYIFYYIDTHINTTYFRE